jgi:hypothetical protein
MVHRRKITIIKDNKMENIEDVLKLDEAIERNKKNIERCELIIAKNKTALNKSNE